MECPICYNIIKNSAIGTCTHHFCLECLIKWCEQDGISCPTCKIPIRSIKRDLEFDKLNGCESLELDTIIPTINIKFDKDTEAGITLVNNHTYLGIGERAPGVVISKLNVRDQCYKCGLRKKDIILFINKIPCMDHKQAINIINSAVDENASISCSLLGRQRNV